MNIAEVNGAEEVNESALNSSNEEKSAEEKDKKSKVSILNLCLTVLEKCF